jgi:hypothetical protein
MTEYPEFALTSIRMPDGRWEHVTWPPDESPDEDETETSERLLSFR